MGLEDHDGPAVAPPRNGVQGCLELAGMVGIVVIDIRTVVNALELHAPGSAGEGNQATGHGFGLDAQGPGGGNGGKGVHAVVLAQNPQVYMGIEAALAHHVETGMPPIKVQGINVHIRGQAKGDEAAVNALERIHGVLVHAVGNDNAAILGGQLCKLTEGVLDVLQVLEEVQMVGVDIQNDSDGGGEVQEGVAVFAGLHDDGVAMAHPMARIQQVQVAANHNRGVDASLHGNMGHHRGSGGFAVGAGEADGVFIGGHNVAPGLRALKHRNILGGGSNDFGVFVVDCGGADDAVGPIDILGLVTNGNGDARLFQMIGGFALMHIGAGNLDAHAVEHHAQGAHRHAADADQVHMLAGL